MSGFAGGRLAMLSSSNLFNSQSLHTPPSDARSFEPTSMYMNLKQEKLKTAQLNITYTPITVI